MRTGMSSRMSNMSLDELHDDDTRSVAASSHVSSHVSVSRNHHNTETINQSEKEYLHLI